MGAFTSSDIQKYQARYSVAPKPAGYQSIKQKNCIREFKCSTRKQYSGIWGMKPFQNDVPESRIGHCTLSLSNCCGAIIAYGCSTNGVLLSDFWFLDLCSAKWTLINIDYSQITPRTGARAVLINDEMWVFGGTNDDGFLSDLHIINFQTGCVKHPTTSGKEPSSRYNHVMSHYNGKLLIYGGSNSCLLTDLFILDLETFVWNEISIAHGRNSPAYCLFNDILYVYGSSSTPGIMKFDFSSSDGVIESVYGIAPPSSIQNATFLHIDQYLILVGGFCDDIAHNDRGFSPIYVFSPETNHWDILPIQPDCNTTCYKDGEMDQDGNFLLPTFSNSSVIYCPAQREIFIFFGNGSTSASHEYIIDISDVLSYFHFQTDMLSLFRK